MISNIFEILGTAQAEYKLSQIEWCWEYINKIRSLILEKFDRISALTLEELDEHIKDKME